MELLLKHSLKLISYEFSDGILFSDLCPQLKNLFPNISFLEKDLLAKLMENAQKFKITYLKSPDNPLFLADKDLIEKYTKQDILSLFISDEEDKREVIIKIYETIVKSREKGINYQEIKQKIKNELKLDLELNMISHYCCKLAACDLVEIIPQKNCKIVKSQIFIPSKLEKTKKKQNNDPEPSNQEKKEEAQIFNFRELTFKQNILINLMSAESHLKNGLSLLELGERIGKPKESKLLNRYLGKMEKEYNICINPERQGRLFSHKYLIKNQKIKEELAKLKESCNLESEKKNKKNINNANNTENFVKMEEESPKIKPKIEEIMAGELKKQENQKLIRACFQDLVKIFALNNEYSVFLQKITEANIFNYFVKLKDSAVKNKKMDEMNNSNEYQLLTENMIKILIEKIEFDLIKNQKVDASNTKSKKQVSKLKINRYIFCLNQIYEQEILLIQKLKQNIIELEFDYGIGKIDRKTVLFMLESLEAIGLIKLIHRDLAGNIEKDEKKNFVPIKQNKNIILLKNISEKDQRIDDLALGLNVKQNFKVAKENMIKSKKISKNKKKIQIKQEKKCDLERLWRKSLKDEPFENSESKKIFSYAKISDKEVKKTILSQTLVKMCNKITKKHMKFMWRKLQTHIEFLCLQDALKKITQKENTCKDNFFNFSKKFEHFSSKFHPIFERNNMNQLNYENILESIDKNIKILEEPLENEEINRNISKSYGKNTNENYRKNEKNIERLKTLLVKYPFKKMKDLEIQLNKINCMDLIWKELINNDLISIYSIDQNGERKQIQELDLKNKQEYYFQVKDNFYDNI